MYGVPIPPSEPSLSTASSSRFKDVTEDNSVKDRPTGPVEPSLFSSLLDNPLVLFTDHRRCFDLVASLVLVWEAVLCFAVVGYVRCACPDIEVSYDHTEIDFSTYLEQAQAFLQGARDYSLIKGESGPAYYPALHIYAYAALSWLTDGGGELKRAQWVFAGLYLATLAVVVFGIYRRYEKIPPYTLILLTLSKRLHSIYMLRMFNDGLVMLLVYSATALYMVPARVDGPNERRRVERRWMLATVLLSCALSIKMSTLLFLPALFYLTFVHFGPMHLVQHLCLLILPLLLLSSPFLTTRSDALAYAAQAFHFSRAFDFRYTLNWRFLGEEAFENPRWGSVLLLAHAVGLLLWAEKWAGEDGGIALLLRRAARDPWRKPSPAALTPSRVTNVFFLSNLTGVLCARSLHPQFYAWFAWTLPWLVAGGAGAGGIDGGQGIALLVAIEYGMSVWPSTVNSSLGLVLAMLVLLVRCYYTELPMQPPAEEEQWVVPIRWKDADMDRAKDE